MFHTAVDKYNIFDATPFQRDPLKELSAACQKYGIKLGFIIRRRRTGTTRRGRSRQPPGPTRHGH